MKTEERNNIYFASDCHFGVPGKEESSVREKRFIEWLDMIMADAKELYLLGDIFDFWFEYKTVIPKGYTRLFGKLAELSDAGIRIHYFIGNHDMWMRDYFKDELGFIIHREPITTVISGKTFMIGHGDGLGPADKGYKFIKKIFANRYCKFLYRWIHPDIGTGLALYFSRKSRISKGPVEKQFKGIEQEWLVMHCRKELTKQHIDYFIFGHRHLVHDYHLSDTSRYVNVGDWLENSNYAVFDGKELTLKKF